MEKLDVFGYGYCNFLLLGGSWVSSSFGRLWSRLPSHFDLNRFKFPIQTTTYS